MSPINLFNLYIFTLTTLLYLPLNTHQTILITSPIVNPFDQSKIPYFYANIGTIPYGKTLTFNLLSTDVQFCSNKLLNQTHFQTPTYLLIDSSFTSCSFTTQAINAQQLGAKGVIFISDIANYYNKIVQVDDGNGRKVHITVLFINTITYRQIHTLKNIKIKVLFERHQSQIANLTYFLSASGRSNYILIRQITPYLQKIIQKINFRPVYMTTQCPNCDESDCLISQDYCTFQLENYKDFDGQFILKQQLRQWSLWKNYGTQAYFKYMNFFDQFCTNKWKQSKQCGDQILKQMSIQKLSVDGSATDIMDEWRIEQGAAGFLSTPEFTINEELYAGSYEPERIFESICQSLIDMPEACSGSVLPQSSSKLVWIIIAIIFGFFITIGIFYLIYKRCIKKQLTNQVYSKINQLVAKYATEVEQHNKKGKNRLRIRLNQQL